MTTNDCDNFHSKLGVLFHTWLRHSNIFDLIDALLINPIHIIKKQNKGTKPIEKKRTSYIEQILLEQITNYKNKQICRLKFLNYVLFKFLPTISL